MEEKLNPKYERIIYEPRRRTQTRRFGGPDDILESDYSSSDTDDNENKDPNGKTDPAGGGDKSGKHKHRGKKSRRGNKNADPNANGQNDNDADWNGGSNDATYADNDTGVWSRDECYKVEKNLLIFGTIFYLFTTYFKA